MEVLVILAVVGFAAYFFADSDAYRKRAAEKSRKPRMRKDRKPTRILIVPQHEIC